MSSIIDYSREVRPLEGVINVANLPGALRLEVDFGGYILDRYQEFANSISRGEAVEPPTLKISDPQLEMAALKLSNEIRKRYFRR